MNKQILEDWFFSHPQIQANQERLDKYGIRMFKNDREKEKSVAMFAVDQKIISRQQMYKIYGKMYYESISD